MTITDERQFARLLIPPKKVIFQGGAYRWPGRPVLASPRSADILPLQQLSDSLSRHSLKARMIRNAFGPAAVRIYRDKDIADCEAYRVTVAPAGIEIHAGADAGAYYALQTLRDMAAIYGRVLPVCRIEDKPDFRRRGVYHDCSRGKVPTLDTLKDLVTRLAHWKINELQLYIENVFTFRKHPEIGRGYSPFTAEEILRLQDHCRMHHVRLVGSLASFGHLEKVLSLPRYRRLGEMPGFRGFAGGTTLCPADPGSIRLISELYREFMPLFEADDFNVCCDETWELGKGRSKRRAARIGTGRVYLDFVLKIHRLCERHGKRMNAWADMVLKYPELLADLPRDIVLLNWEYEHNGSNIARTKEIAGAGFRLMVCPGTSGWLTHGSRLANSLTNVTKFASEGRRHHAEGLLNTDWGDQGHRNFLGVSLHGFAHGAAHAWHGKAVDNTKFTGNFCRQVFGERTGRMAEALQLLGNTHVTCGCPCRNESLLYHALVEPLLHIRPPERSPIDMMDQTGLQRIIDQLSARALWPSPQKPMAPFERLALRELKLAARMDCLASRRALTAKALRAGKTVRNSELRRLSRQIHDMAEDFEKLWLARNKVSRLRDNCKLFKRVRHEASRLAGGSRTK
ncbi:MAG TPA: beta-N-acetylhexosaminidase [Sedimentisphaerales bacterium]|nr:beta-N-acetylhexosaminidase [Sedimentisphaerales bacterium]